LVFDATATIDSDNIGAFVRSADGSLITDHEIVESEFASLVSQGLVFRSKLAGAIGNTYSFQVIDSTGSGPMTYTEIAGAIVVDLVGTTPTKAQVAALLATSAYANVSVGTPAAGNVVVTSQVSFTNGADAAVHTYLDVYSATADGFGNPITSTSGALDVNIKSPINVAVDMNGIYNGSTNPTPDNVGIIGSSRSAAGLANQTLQFTGAGVGSDDVATANIVAQDVNSFGMVWDSVGGNWDRAPGNSTDGMLVKVTNSLSLAGNVADDAVDSGNPIKVGSRSKWGALTAISQDLDRADLVSDKYRRVYVNNGPNIAARNLNITVGATEVELKSGASALEGRRLLMIQNLSNKEIYIGKTGVLSTTGLVIAARATISLDVGQDVALFALGSTTNQDVRVFELA
jgi:hypothetical protein